MHDTSTAVPLLVSVVRVPLVANCNHQVKYEPPGTGCRAECSTLVKPNSLVSVKACQGNVAAFQGAKVLCSDMFGDDVPWYQVYDTDAQQQQQVHPSPTLALC